MKDKYLTVSAITRYLKSRFDLDENLQTVFLKGEISNFKAHTSGHFYFSLKDENSKINAVMFRNQTKNVLFKPKDGTKVLLTGRISLYEAMGSYQIYVDEMIEDGVGNLYLAFEQLKEKLSKEGLFDDRHKQKIPKVPKKVGIITAPTGAAIRDIITTIKRRFNVCETILFPTLVQGENAKEDIVKNIKRAQKYDLDVLIIGRGGGSIEDLWPFNEEIVARAIYECKIPTISAVGHEIDFTISDFVADLRAPTPTAAAELAVPNMADLKSKLNGYLIRLNEGIYKKINYNKLYLDSVKNSFVIKNPMVMYENKRQNLDLLSEKINSLVTNNIKNHRDKITLIKKSYIFYSPDMIYKKYRDKIDSIKSSYVLSNPMILYKDKKSEIKNIIEKLELLNPLNILNRGYSISYLDEKVIKSIKSIKKNDIISIRVSDGIIKTKAVEVEDK